MSEPFCVRVEAFSTSQVVSLLQNVPEKGTIEIPPAKPKASEVYIFKYDQESKKGTLVIPVRQLALGRVANVKNRHLQNDLLIAVICWTNFHQNTAVVALNSIASLG